MRALLVVALFATACTKDDPVDDTSDTDEEDFQAVGDFTCYTAGTVWLTQAVDPLLQVTATHTELVLDFENETPVEESSVDFWLDDDVTTAADATIASDDFGYVTFQVPECTPVAYRAWTPVDLDETKDTYEVHQIYDPDAEDGDAPFNSVSKITYNVIPSLMGVSVDPAAATVAGAFYDCNGDPIEGALVRVVDEDGNEPDTAVVKYFVDNFPNRDQPYTSPDGLFVAMNVPVGTWHLEAHISDGEGGRLTMGATELTTFADSINISNIYTGFGDGVRYPDSCLLVE